MRLLLCLLLSVACVSAPAATWHVDLYATNGLQNGTTRANAWLSMTNLDRSLGKVSAGDTVIVWGATYPDHSPDGTNGTLISLQEGSMILTDPWTRYYFSNGVEKVTSSYLGFYVHDYTEIVAPQDPGYVTNMNLLNTYDTFKITNNCGLHIVASTNYWTSGGQCLWFVGSPTVVQWVHETGSYDQVTTNGVHESGSPNQNFYDDGSGKASNELAFVWNDASGGYGAAAVFAVATANLPNTFGTWNIHHTLSENIESDLSDVGGGFEFHHNIVHNRYGGAAGGGVPQQCDDTFVLSGDTAYTRIYNNIIEPADNTLTYLWGSVSNVHDFYFYGNVIQPVRPGYQALTVQGNGIWEQGTDLIPAANLSRLTTNIVYALNTLICTTNDGANGLIALITKNTLAFDFTVDSGAVTIKDNLAVHIDAKPVGGPPLQPFSFTSYSSSDPYGTNDGGYGWIFTTNSFVMDYNQFWSYDSPSAPNLIVGSFAPKAYMVAGGTPQLMTNSADVARVMGYTNNVTGSPVQFVSTAPNNPDWHPLSTAVGQNLSLTSLTNLMPNLATDIYGRRRNNWMGAVEPGGLVLWYTFNRSDGWTTNGILTDQSGSGNTGYKYASTNFQTWPTWTNGPTVQGVQLDAAQFTVDYTNGGFHFGTYIVCPLTNAANPSLFQFTNMTVSCWANVDYAYALGYSGDEQFFTTGQNSNNWFFGNYYSTANTSGPQFSRASTAGGQEPMETYARWPNITNNSWHLYTITWDGTNMVPYLDGTNWTHSTDWTNANSFVFTTMFNGVLVSTNAAGSGAYNWIGIGCNTHSNLPFPDGGLGPNNGFLQGQLADMRIYNRSLSAGEVQALFGAPDPTDPAITQNPQNRTISVGQTATFTVGASGQSPLSYQWQWQGTNVAGATQSQYTTPVQNAAGNTTLDCVVTDAAGSATSASATLSVVTDPQITVQPQSQTVNVGQSATFTVTAVCQSTPVYQWKFNGTVVGGNSSSYTRSNCQIGDNGGQVIVSVTDAAGSLDSNPAVLTVLANQVATWTGGTFTGGTGTR